MPDDKTLQLKKVIETSACDPDRQSNIEHPARHLLICCLSKVLASGRKPGAPRFYGNKLL